MGTTDGPTEKRTERRCRRCGDRLWRVSHPEASVVGYRCKGMREDKNYWGEKMLVACGMTLAVMDGGKARRDA